MRTYKLVNGKSYCSRWSEIVTVKTRGAAANESDEEVQEILPPDLEDGEGILPIEGLDGELDMDLEIELDAE